MVNVEEILLLKPSPFSLRDLGFSIVFPAPINNETVRWCDVLEEFGSVCIKG